MRNGRIHIRPNLRLSEGMSDELGLRIFGTRQELVFQGRQVSEQRNYGERVIRQIDGEIIKIIETAYARRKKYWTLIAISWMPSLIV